jgi:glucose/arabinose dehydrogenase
LKRNLIVGLVALAGCSGGGGGGGGDSVPSTQVPLALVLQQVATGLDNPVFLTAPEADARLFIVERSGRIRIFRSGALLSVPFLDIHERTTTDGERGLLSMAFHPQYAQNGFFFAITRT